MICEKCGKEIPENATYCPNCGIRTDGKIKCHACGNFVMEGAYCTECGARIDGKTVCTCGTEYIGKFCPSCGKSSYIASSETKHIIKEPAVAETGKQKIDAQKILNYAALIFICSAALFSFIFVFCIGIHNTYEYHSESISNTHFIYHYFGKAYKNIKDSYPFVSNWTFGTIISAYLPIIFGTLISAVTLSGVLCSAVVTAVKCIAKFAYKKKVCLSKPALATFLFFTIGAFALLALNVITNTVEYYYINGGASDTYSSVNGLNGATIAGLVLSSVGVAGFIVCKVVEKILQRKNRQDVIILSICCVLVLLSYVAIILISTAPIVVKATINLTNERTTYEKLATSFMFILNRFIDLDLPNDVAVKLGVYSIVGFIMQLVLLVFVAVILAKLIKSVADGKKPNVIAPTVGALVFSILYLVAAVLDGNEFLSMLLSGFTNHARYVISYGTPIATLVMVFLVFVGSIIVKAIKLLPTQNINEDPEPSVIIDENRILD